MPSAAEFLDAAPAANSKAAEFLDAPASSAAAFLDERQPVTSSLQPDVPAPGHTETTQAPPSMEAFAPENNPLLTRLVQQHDAVTFTPEERRRLDTGTLAENLTATLPGLTAPSVTREDVLQHFPSMTEGDAGIVAGLLQTGASVWNGIASPAGLATIAPTLLTGSPGVAGVIGAAATGTFAVEAAARTPELIDAFQGALHSRDPEAIARTASALAVNSTIAIGAAKGMREGLASTLETAAATDRVAPRSDALDASTVSSLAPKSVEAAATAPETLKAPVEAAAKTAIESPEAPVADALAPSTIIATESSTVQSSVTATDHTTQVLGILPPGTPEAIAAIKDTALKLDNLRQGFTDLVTRTEPKADLVRRFDAADNTARIEGEQIGNTVRLDVPSAIDRNALTFIIEANGDRAKLDEFALQVAGKSVSATRAIADAQANWERLTSAADRITALHDNQLDYERANGHDPGEVEAYVRHAYDMDAMIGKGRPVLITNSSGGTGVSTSFGKQRAFASYAEAIEAGYKPRTFDIADLVQSRITIGERLVNRSNWAKALGDIIDPVEGRPITTAMITQPKGTQVAPLGYQPREIMPGIRVAVHEGYADLVDSLVARSRVAANPVLNALIRGEYLIKHGMLLLDTFHAGRMIYKELAMTRTLGHDLGRSLLEYNDTDLSKAVAAGEITREAADWALANRPDAQLLIDNGLNVGRIADALYKDTVKQIPLVGDLLGKAQRWIFDKLTRGAMLHSAIIELRRAREHFPDKTHSELAATVSQNINLYYGNLMHQSWVKDATLQDLLRMAMLAPQWVEAMARTEVGAYGQAARMPVDMARGKPLFLGPLAKAVATGVGATFIANQLINLATRGHPTWQNPEHGHQMDAWIPDVTGRSPGFFLNPLSIFAELSHDAYRYYSEDPHALKVIARIANNKLSPLVHSAEVLATGHDWMGRDLNGTWNTLKEAGRTLVPLPLPLQGFINPNPSPGSLARQIFGSLGIKVEPAPSAESQLNNLAHQWMESHNLKPEPSTPSDYRDLNVALKRGDGTKAKQEYDKLVADKGAPTVIKHYTTFANRLYTGKRITEAQFQQTLSPEQHKLYREAAQERAKLSQQFGKMLRDTRPPAAP